MNKNIIRIFILTVTALGFTACSGNTAKPAEQLKTDGSKVETDNTKANANEPAKSDAKANTTAAQSSALDKSACLTAKMDGKKLIPSQTFVFDNEPFTKSCFVTFANKEDMLDDKDLPRGSEFYIFKDGKQVYKFDDAFDGQPACWVEGVGFEDLNGDKKTDVIIAGKCLAAKDSYSVNAVYANEGGKFKTDGTANQELENFTTIKQLSDFVKKNNGKFFAAK
jgi:hypothetical protein